MNKDISVIRREYLYASLTEAEMSADPVEQFHRWFEEARTAGIDLPNAMSLATAGSDGMPSVRIVLLKDYDSDGFVFYSHADSPKGRQLAEVAPPREGGRGLKLIASRLMLSTA